MCFLISLSQKYLPIVLAHCMLLCHALAATVFLVAHPVSSRAAPHVAPRSSRAMPPSSSRRTPSPAAPAPACYAPRPRCCAPRPVPHAHRGAAGVLPRCCPRRRSPLEGHGHCQRHGRRDARPQQGDVAMKAHVGSICFKYFRCFRGMLQLFHMDVAKVDRRWFTCCKCSKACCKCFRGLFEMFHLF
jgi:hypothetical protein